MKTLAEMIPPNKPPRITVQTPDGPEELGDKIANLNLEQARQLLAYLKSLGIEPPGE